MELVDSLYNGTVGILCLVPSCALFGSTHRCLCTCVYLDTCLILLDHWYFMAFHLFGSDDVVSSSRRDVFSSSFWYHVVDSHVISLVLQFTAWFLQVYIGHSILEQNHPSMMKKLTINSIVLSLLLAWDTDTMIWLVHWLIMWWQQTKGERRRIPIPVYSSWMILSVYCGQLSVTLWSISFDYSVCKCTAPN